MNDLPDFNSVGGIGTDIVPALKALRDKMKAEANQPPKPAYIYMDRAMLGWTESLGLKVIDGKLVKKP